MHISKNILLNETLHSKIELKVKNWQMGIRLRHFLRQRSNISHQLAFREKEGITEFDNFIEKIEIGRHLFSYLS